MYLAAVLESTKAALPDAAFLLSYRGVIYKAYFKVLKRALNEYYLNILLNKVIYLIKHC